MNKQPTRITDGQIDYKGHVIVPVRYGDGSNYNWTVEIDGVEKSTFSETRSFTIELAKAIIDSE